MTSPTGRPWRGRHHSSYYPLLLSGLGMLEYLSPEDCALIADALAVSVNPNADEDLSQVRRQQLAECFARGAGA